jgi:hypothetical protein
MMKITSFSVTNQHLQTLGIYLILFTFFSFMPHALMAQGVVGGLKNISKTVQLVVNVVFTIAIVIGLISVIIGFISDNPNKIMRLVYLIVAVLLWFGFTFVFEQVKTDVGGQGGFNGN